MDWNNPTLTTDYDDVMADYKSRDASIATWFDGNPDTNIPTDAKRHDVSGSGAYFQYWNGSAWATMGVGIGADITYHGSDSKIVANTTVDNDTKQFWVCGGGGSSPLRGAGVGVYGNEHASAPGCVWYRAGSDVAAIGPASGAHIWEVNGVQAMRLWTNGTDRMWLAVSNASNQAFRVATDTADGADNQGLVLCGGGASGTSRGAYLSMYGNEHGGGLSGWAQLRTGAETGATLQLVNSATNGPIQHVLSTGGTVDIVRGSATPWQLDGDEKVLHKSHSGYAGSEYIRKTFAGSVTTTGTTNLFTLALAADTNYNIVVRYTMNRTSGTHAESGVLHATAYRDGSGSATIAGSGVNTVASAQSGRTGNDPSLSLIVSGNNAVVRLSGGTSGTMLAVGTIEWQACPNSSS